MIILNKNDEHLDQTFEMRGHFLDKASSEFKTEKIYLDNLVSINRNWICKGLEVRENMACSRNEKNLLFIKP